MSRKHLLGGHVVCWHVTNFYRLVALLLSDTSCRHHLTMSCVRLPLSCLRVSLWKADPQLAWLLSEFRSLLTVSLRETSASTWLLTGDSTASWHLSLPWNDLILHQCQQRKTIITISSNTGVSSVCPATCGVAQRSCLYSETGITQWCMNIRNSGSVGPPDSLSTINITSI